MLVRPKQIDGKIRWRRLSRGRRDGGRMEASAQTPASGREEQAQPGGTRPPTYAGQPRVPGRERRSGPSEDRSIYTCQCGYVFQALVSTSVGCPHCGSTQAW
jgi:hypothetical protein